MKIKIESLPPPPFNPFSKEEETFGYIPHKHVA